MIYTMRSHHNSLPYVVINRLNTARLEKSVRVNGRKLVNLLQKLVRISLHILFLQTCLQFKTNPKFVDNCLKLPVNATSTDALQRKATSFKLEIIRSMILTLRKEKDSINQWSSYEYLNFTRMAGDHTVTRTILKMIESALLQESKLIFERHSEKWYRWTNKQFPLSEHTYRVDFRPKFPFKFKDELWFNTASDWSTIPDPNNNSHIGNFSKNITNDTELSIPADISTFLSKGPKFRLPNDLNDKFMDSIVTNLDHLQYKLRWSTAIKNTNQNKLNIPFHKNTVKLPPTMNPQAEDSFKLFKRETLDILNKERTFMKNKYEYKKTCHLMRKTKKFLTDNKLVAVSSDKTNRIVVTDKAKLVSRVENILKDTETYKQIPKSKSLSIERQTNKLIKSRCKHNPSLNTDKLLSSGGKPAKFYVTIKDHKDKSSEGYPLRPIASVVGTPIEKVDWLVGHLINQLVKFIPSHLKNTEDLIQKLSNVLTDTSDEVRTFISLDVVNLYTSIPLLDGIKRVVSFASAHWDSINNYGLGLNDLEDFLKFVCFNYEVTYNGNHYLQIRCCPMEDPFFSTFRDYI